MGMRVAAEPNTALGWQLAARSLLRMFTPGDKGPPMAGSALGYLVYGR